MINKEKFSAKNTSTKTMFSMRGNSVPRPKLPKMMTYNGWTPKMSAVKLPKGLKGITPQRDVNSKT